MGSKYSQNNREEKSPEKIYKTKQKYNTEPYDTSISTKTNEYTDKSSITTTTEFNDNQQKKVPYKFEWKGDGREVLLTGDFVNWNEKIKMKKNKKTGYFEVVLFLERKKHDFKFIIDGNWICSNQYPTNEDDNHNVNNFISLTNYFPAKELLKLTEESKDKNTTNTEEENNDKNIEDQNQNLIIKKEEIKKKQYISNFPLINELNTLAPIIMRHYRPIFNLDYPSTQDFIKINKKFNFLTYKEKNFNTENNTYKKIMTCPHEKLMHFCTNLDDIRNIENNFFRLCTTVRTKHKFLTLIYYKPK